MTFPTLSSFHVRSVLSFELLSFTVKLLILGAYSTGLVYTNTIIIHLHFGELLTINYFLYKTQDDDVISHVTLLTSSFLLTVTKIVCY